MAVSDDPKVSGNLINVCVCVSEELVLVRAKVEGYISSLLAHI